MYVKNIVVYNCFASTQWLLQTRQLFPGQNQALVCLIQPKTGNYVHEYENMNFMRNVEVRQKVNECFSPLLRSQRFDRSCEKPRDCFGKKVLDCLSFFFLLKV